jgi:hypothetical protein
MPEIQALAGEDHRALRRGLAGVLARALAPADGIVGDDIDYDTATAAEALGRAAPAETAQMLIDRIVSATLPVMPFTWEELLNQTLPGQREPLAIAYQERIEPQLAARALSVQTETAALDVLALLGRGTPRWAGLVRSWAADDATDRARAANAVRDCWQDPVWRELVPELLDTGLSEQSASELRLGLLPINGAVDSAGISNRLNALQPLLDDTRPVVRQFAAEADQSLHALMSALRAGSSETTPLSA